MIDYSLDEIPDTTMVINPAYRMADGLIRKLVAKHSCVLAEFASLHLDESIEPENVAAYELKKSKLLEAIQGLEGEIIKEKQARKEMKKHIPIKQLPEEERFKRLAHPAKKRLFGHHQDDCLSC